VSITVSSARRPAFGDLLERDADLRRVLAERGVAVDALQPLAQGRSAPIRRLRCDTGTGSGLLIELAASEAGSRQLRNEASGRRWAAAAGVRTPAVVGHDPAGGWLVGEAAAPAVRDVAYVDAVLEQAELIGAAAVAPPPSHDTRSWESSPLTRVARASLVAAGGLSVPLFLRSRRAYHALAFDRPVHGDFYYLNVLRDPRGRATVVDWEYLGWGPRFSDALRMWASLPERHLRDHLVDRLLEQCSTPRARAQLGVVARWMVVRQIGENLSSLRHRSRESLAHARSMLPEALALAESLGVR